MQMTEEKQVQNFVSFDQAFTVGNGQDGALGWLKSQQIQVAIFLMSGIKLEGVVTGYDPYCVMLRDSNGNQQMIYKAKISTISCGNQTRVRKESKKAEQER